MPFEDLPYDQFITKWSNVFLLLSAIVGYFYGAIGFLFIFAAFNILVPYSLFASYLVFTLPIFYFPLILSRNRIIRSIFEKKTNKDSYYITNLLKYISVIVIFAIGYVLFFLTQKK